MALSITAGPVVSNINANELAITSASLPSGGSPDDWIMLVGWTTGGPSDASTLPRLLVGSGMVEQRNRSIGIARYVVAAARRSDITFPVTIRRNSIDMVKIARFFAFSGDRHEDTVSVGAPLRPDATYIHDFSSPFAAEWVDSEWFNDGAGFVSISDFSDYPPGVADRPPSAWVYSIASFWDNRFAPDQLTTVSAANGHTDLGRTEVARGSVDRFAVRWFTGGETALTTQPESYTPPTVTPTISSADRETAGHALAWSYPFVPTVTRRRRGLGLVRG